MNNSIEDCIWVIKIVVKVKQEDREYYPVMIELIHLLEKNHTIRHEEEIIDRIEKLESANPESVLTLNPQEIITWLES